jgi:hypothetical protein
MNMMLSYHNVGSIKRKQFLKEDGSSQDPIWGVWVWKSPTIASADGKAQM